MCVMVNINLRLPVERKRDLNHCHTLLNRVYNWENKIFLMRQILTKKDP